MQRSSRLLTAVVAAAICSTGALVAGAGSAAAATCFGDGCTGKDPIATGCANDAVTVASIKLPWVIQTLDLRWSPSCKTNWARMQYDANPTWLRAIQPDRGDGLPRVVQISGRNGVNSWSAMIYSPTLCVYADVQTANWGRYRTACV
jgi:hypothetical protein